MKLNHNKKSVKISLNLFALYAVMVCGVVFALPAFAASDPLVVVENLSTFIFSLIRAVGLILLGWGIVQVGLSLQSHAPSQRSQGFLTLAGGLVITFAKEILNPGDGTRANGLRTGAGMSGQFRPAGTDGVQGDLLPAGHHLLGCGIHGVQISVYVRQGRHGQLHSDAAAPR